MEEQRAVGCGLHFWFRWAGSESEWAPMRCPSRAQGVRTRACCPTHPSAYVINEHPSSPAFMPPPRIPVTGGQPWATCVRLPSRVLAVGQPGSSPVCLDPVVGTGLPLPLPPGSLSCRTAGCTPALHTSPVRQTWPSPKSVPPLAHSPLVHAAEGLSTSS